MGRAFNRRKKPYLAKPCFHPHFASSESSKTILLLLPAILLLLIIAVHGRPTREERDNRTQEKRKKKKKKSKRKKEVQGQKYNAVRVNEINKSKKKKKKDRKIKRRKERKKTRTFQGTLLLFFFFLFFFSFCQANLQRLLRASFLRNLIRICRYQKTTPRNAPGLPVYQQLHAKTFTLIGRHTAPLVLQSRRQGAFVGLLAWLPGCLLACLPAGIFCWARFPDTQGPLGRGRACFGSRSLSRPSSCSPPEF